MEQTVENAETAKTTIDKTGDSQKMETDDSQQTNNATELDPVLKDDDIIIDRNPVALAYCEIPNVHSKEKEEKPEESIKIFEEIAGTAQVVRNNTEVRKATSVKSFGYDTESEFEFSEDDSDFGDDFKTIRTEAKDSDDEFDRLVKYSSKIIEKIHKSEYPDSVPPNSKKAKKPLKAPKTKNFHEYDDLPPIENLTINCGSSLIEFGFVSKVVDCMVLVESTSHEVLDFDSYLFDEKAKAIGQVYDIFGQVKNPCYAIRFNSHEEASLIPINMKVYFAPNEEELTKTPFKGLNLAAASRDAISEVNRKLDQKDAMEKAKLQKEQRIEGVDSDVEFSDDEAEKEYRKKMKNCNIEEKNHQRGNRKRDRRGGMAMDSRRVQFADQNSGNRNFAPNYRGRGGRGGFRGSQRPGQWDWHSNPNTNSQAPRTYRRDFDGPATTSPAVNQQASALGAAAPSSQQKTEQQAKKPESNSDNPYAEFGCYSGYSGRFGI